MTTHAPQGTQCRLEHWNTVAVEDPGLSHADVWVLGIAHQPTHGDARAGDIRNSLADISKAERLLGYKPAFNFPEGLKKTVEYFRAKA